MIIIKLYFDVFENVFFLLDGVSYILIFIIGIYCFKFRGLLMFNNFSIIGIFLESFFLKISRLNMMFLYVGILVVGIFFVVIIIVGVICLIKR